MPEEKINYDILNETELVELCRQEGYLAAHRGLGRVTLIGLLAGEIDYDDCPRDPIDADREVMCYMQEHYPDIIFGQLRCASEDYACHACPPGRVVGCAVVNCDPDFRSQVLDELKLEGKAS